MKKVRKAVLSAVLLLCLTGCITTSFTADSRADKRLSAGIEYKPAELDLSIKITSDANYPERIIKSFTREECKEAFEKRASEERAWKISTDGTKKDFTLRINVHSHMSENIPAAIISGFTLSIFPFIVETQTIDVRASLVNSSGRILQQFSYPGLKFLGRSGWPAALIALFSSKDSHYELADYVIGAIKNDLAKENTVFDSSPYRSDSGKVTAVTGYSRPASAVEAVYTLSVMDFTLQDLSEAEGALITDLISSAVHKSGRYKVIDRQQRGLLLEEIKFSLDGCVDESCQLEAGRLLSADRIIIGSLGKMGSRIIFNLSMVDVETGESIGSESRIFLSLDELVDECSGVAMSIAKE